MEPKPPLADRFSGLGYRHPDYKPTAVDHGVYEMLWERFLRSPRGRAALFASGVVGCLARLVVDEDLASLGPSGEVFETGARFWDGRSLTAYWDDALTDQEIELICGVYKIATGTTDDPQTTKISWWPKPITFSTLGLNMGWWSPDCERWFQQRLLIIKSGNAKLHTQKQWKRTIKFFQKSRQVAIANEKAAAQFLTSVLHT
ncbi:hypothetical protein B0H17DRAFT_945641 [Mycena rosella]|uniref:Uncharacterized protein n=1 Tax=Mycena rosella TaxID=1033263 RepID=A0AAD7D3A5_MYCRO|nr:hypothetical protein B0H17DRAFT_945641 [Mycena rosella]